MDVRGHVRGHVPRQRNCRVVVAVVFPNSTWCTYVKVAVR